MKFTKVDERYFFCMGKQKKIKIFGAAVPLIDSP